MIKYHVHLSNDEGSVDVEGLYYKIRDGVLTVFGTAGVQIAAFAQFKWCAIYPID